jgi:hypothetical protein
MKVRTPQASLRGRSAYLALLAPWLFAAGCSPAPSSNAHPPSSAFLEDAPFVAVDRPLPAATVAAAASLRAAAAPDENTPQSFYLAINKKELGQRWFLSAYLRQYFPGNVGYGAAASLGVRVVTFRLQNGKLFVFDASDNVDTSDTFSPELLIEAYPVVETPDFLGAPGSGGYVLFDPAAGLNRFGVLSDWFGTAAIRFSVDLAFLQRYRKITDGITFEEVFTGVADRAIGDGTIDPNQLRGSGTLGLALRRYSEGAGYSESPLPDQEMYFRSDVHLVANTGESYQSPIKWNIHKGMKPIRWTLSNQFFDLKKDPRYAAYDIAGAVKKGVENWNAVFGFKAIEAVFADPSESFADDDKNYLVFDKDPTYGYAFANWRSNPNNGEVRGASVYFNGAFLVPDLFVDDPGVGGATGAPPGGGGSAGAPSGGAATGYTGPRALPTMVWGNLRNEPLCVMWAPTAGALAADAAAAAGPTGAPRTKKEKFEAYITHVINHEIGHTLGLRHNFKGSLVPPSTSVMDYLGTEDRSRMDKPGSYDTAAIQFLYGLRATPPSDAFCTDGDVLADPDCSRFDFGVNPLVDDFFPYYGGVLANYLAGTSAGAPNISLNNILKYIRGGTSAQRLQAWPVVMAGLLVPADATKVATIPGYGARVDNATNIIFKRLYLDSTTARTEPNNGGAWLQDPPLDPQWMPLVLAELEANLVNADGIRSYATRRTAVAILKKLQLTTALSALVDARAAIAATRPALTGDDAVLTDELLSRIDAATSSYFN